MTKKSILNLIFIAISNLSFTQTKINGTILYELSPVNYAKVYLQSQKGGTLSNKSGFFEFIIDENNLSQFDTLVVESNGYSMYKVAIEKGNYSFKIELTKKSIELEEFVVNPIYKLPRILQKFNKERRTKHSGIVLTPFQEQAIYIQNPIKEKGEIKKISLYISFFTNVNAPFRINIYAVNPINGLPTISLLNNDLILLPIITEGGWMEINLDSLHISIPTNGFFVSVEALPFETLNLSDKNKTFSTSPLSFGAGCNKSDEYLFHYLRENGKSDKSSSNSSVNWIKSSNKHGHIALKIELEVFSNSKTLIELEDEKSNTNDTLIGDFSKKDIDKNRRHYPKINSIEYPNSTIKELLESSIKSYYSIDNYDLIHLYKVPLDFKEEYLEFINNNHRDKDFKKNMDMDTTERNLEVYYRKFLETIETAVITDHGNGIYTLTSNNKKLDLLFQDEKWYIFWGI